MILREYLYVDTAVVRGVVAQLESGIEERSIESDRDHKDSQIGAKGLFGHSRQWGGSTTTEKSLGDAIFPKLELALETEGLLSDISDELTSPETWDPQTLISEYPPGRIVRMTAPGGLFDSRFIASVLTGFVTTAHGLLSVGAFGEIPGEPVVPPKVKKQANSTRRDSYKPLPGEEDELEAGIPLGKIKMGEDDTLEGGFLRGIVQMSRGIFGPGLHLALSPLGPEGPAVLARLQEGKDFLDTSPDVLFERFGVGSQEWTVVGTIGHHPLPTPDMGEANFMTDGLVHRSAFGHYVNQLATLLSNLGFSGLPQAPGFALVPWAVYRTIGNPVIPPGELELS